jgi:cytochrome c-type biogenesis protein CcmH
MKRIVFALPLLLFAAIAAGIDAESFTDPALQSRYQNLTRELRCVQCQNQTIADSDAPIAVDLRRELRELLAAGKSDDEVLTFLTDRYGDFVLYRPPFVARTWMLWAGPIVVLFAAAGAAIVVIRRRANMPLDKDTDEEVSAQ